MCTIITQPAAVQPLGWAAPTPSLQFHSPPAPSCQQMPPWAVSPPSASALPALDRSCSSSHYMKALLTGSSGIAKVRRWQGGAHLANLGPLLRRKQYGRRLLNMLQHSRRCLGLWGKAGELVAIAHHAQKMLLDAWKPFCHCVIGDFHPFSAIAM